MTVSQLELKKQTNHENEISSQGLASHILWILPTFLGLIPDTSRQQERYYCYFSSSRWSVARFPVPKPKKRLQRKLFWPDHPRNVMSSHICRCSIPYVEHMGFHLDQLFILNTLLLSSQGLESGLWSLKGSSFMSLRRAEMGGQIVGHLTQDVATFNVHCSWKRVMKAVDKSDRRQIKILASRDLVKHNVFFSPQRVDSWNVQAENREQSNTTQCLVFTWLTVEMFTGWTRRYPASRQTWHRLIL